MPKISRESATGGGEFGPVTDRSGLLDGLFRELHVVQ